MANGLTITPTGRAGHLRAALRKAAPPVGEFRFWVLQAGLLSLAIADALLDMYQDDLDHVPPSITLALLLGPVIYAALNFGVRGAIFTALWATFVALPHWILIPQMGIAHRATELTFLLVLNIVAVVVGQRVEHEQVARERAEAALRAVTIAETRYRSLFEDQPAPVIITDPAGEVTELNSAAARLLAPVPVGRPVESLIGVTVATLLDEPPNCLAVRSRQDRDQVLLFAPTASRLAVDNGTGVIQIVLTDVTEQHRRQRQQRMFATQLLRVQEEERKGLARELHDDPLQNLTFLTRMLDDLSNHPRMAEEFVPGLSQGGALATSAAVALRKIIRGLRPPVLDDLGLTAALTQLADQVRRRGGLAVEVTITGTPGRLAPEVELTAYRVAQESLNNVLKHAKASRVAIVLRHGTALTLTVADDGLGMQPGNGTPAAGHGLGLLGMRERVGMVGGTLDIGPATPRGTLLRACLPAARLADPAEAAPDPGAAAPDPAGSAPEPGAAAPDPVSGDPTTVAPPAADLAVDC